MSMCLEDYEMKERPGFYFSGEHSCREDMAVENPNGPNRCPRKSIQCQLLWCERSHMRSCSECKGWGSMFQGGGKAQRGEVVGYSARAKK